MAKAIPKTGLRRNVRIGARKIPKGVIHVQASFNNTIVTVTDVRGRVFSWSSAGTCGFKGTRRGTPFAAQTAMPAIGNPYKPSFPSNSVSSDTRNSKFVRPIGKLDRTCLTSISQGTY